MKDEYAVRIAIVYGGAVLTCERRMASYRAAMRLAYLVNRSLDCSACVLQVPTPTLMLTTKECSERPVV